MGLGILLGWVCLQRRSWQLSALYLCLVFSAWVFYVLNNVFIETCASAVPNAGTGHSTAALLSGRPGDQAGLLRCSSLHPPKPHSAREMLQYPKNIEPCRLALARTTVKS